MFGFLKKLIATPKAIDVATDVVKSGIDGIGKCFFTEQERAEFTLEAAQMWIRVQESIAHESGIRSMTRRIIALLGMGTFLILLLGAAVAWPFHAAYSAFLLSLAKELGGLTFAITSFYFGIHLLRSLKK